MRIGLQTWGSHGSIRPFIALAEGLQAAGNQVHLVLTCIDSDVYKDYVPANGLQITVLASPVLEPARQQELTRIACEVRSPVEQMEEIMRLSFAPVEDRMFEAARALCRNSDSLIGHYLMHPLSVSAEKAGCPYVSVMLSHAAIPSEHTNPMGSARLGKFVNRMLWRLTRSVLNRYFLHYPNRLRRQLGLRPGLDLIDEVWITPDMTLVAISPQICKIQPDWSDAIEVCGFLDVPNLSIEGTLPQALSEFLAAGDAPVYMTFGSWMPKDADGQTDMLHLLTEAAHLAGCRAIIQSRSAQDCGFHSDDRILYVSSAPHQTIFPHCRAIVHHGGAGTTQAATQAGVPSVVVANQSEQAHWGRELRRLRIAGKPLARRGLKARALAKRIRQVLGKPGMAGRAKSIGAAMAAENGVREAVRLLMQRFDTRRHDEKTAA